MSIESTSPTTEQSIEGDQNIYVIIWFWKEKPGGGLAHIFLDRVTAFGVFGLLAMHGDPSKGFELIPF